MMLRYILLIVCSAFCMVAFPQSPLDRDYWIERYLSVSYPLKTVKVSSSYGSRKDPFTGEKAFHGGLDLKASYEEVYAMFDGSIAKTGSDERSGHFVIISHGEYTVSYCHLSKVLVRAGDQILAGDVVAVSGNTGRSTGPHLHITSKYHGEQRDPSTLLLYVTEVRAEAVAALGGQDSKAISLNEFDKKAFIERYASAAMQQQQLYGIPSSVTLAQMAYESFWGCSPLAMSSNNFFGIKCSREWLASGKPYSLHSDDRPNEKFCKYDTVDESIEHHSRLLMGYRYRRCRSYPSTDYHNWLVSIKAAGYATAPDYVKKLESLIRKYKLYVYDQLAVRA